MFGRTLSLLFGVSLAVAISGRVTCAQTISIFGDAVPINPIDDGNAVTLGVKFWSSQPGAISGIRFYRAVGSPQGYVAKLYSADGTLLGSVTLAHESGPVAGWQIANFASPIPIKANTTYIAAYYSAVGQGAWDEWGLSNGVTSGPLTAPASSATGGNGVYHYNNTFPSNSYDSSNYYVDVAFSPAASPAAAASYLILSFNPPKPSITSGAPLGSVVATIVASWSDGTPFTGTLSFAPPYSNNQGVFAISGNKLILNPAGPGVLSDANATLNVTIVATQ
jgi:Domain of unknown function (DUF4082)